jgi:hypothetical protein
MRRKLLISTFYSIIAFFNVSYISLTISILSSLGNHLKKSVTNLVFYFKYYYQFCVSGLDYPNCGCIFNYFIW